MYSRDSVIAVRPFTRQPEGEDVIIGTVDTGVFLAVPPEAVEVLEQLAQGKSIGEVSDLYQQQHGETLDLEDFLTVLEAKGIVRPAGEAGTEAQAAVAAGPAIATRKFHFSNFPQPLARAIFGRLSLPFYFAVILLALAAMYIDPSLRPGSKNLLFSDRRAISWGVVLLAYYAALYVHELSHLIAARAVGINSRIGLSHRLWFVVAETDLTGLWSVPKRDRYLPLLAGMLVDATSAAALVLLVFGANRHWLSLPPFAVRIAQALVFSYVIMLVWQGFLFVRTDLYYVIASVFNCRNLLGDTEVFLRNQLARVVPSVRKVDQSGIRPFERRVIHGYAGIWIAGRVAAVLTFILVTIPLGIGYFRNVSAAFRVGYAKNPSDFIDALLLAAFFIVPLSVGFALWIGGMLRRERT